MLIWAHRGASAYAPENTLEAFQLAVAMKADGVELDAHICKSGEVVVAHDEKVDRVSDGRGFIAEMTLGELKSLDFGVRFPAYRGAKIPTLKEVYALLAPTGLTVNVELKTTDNEYPGIERLCLELAEEMGMKERVIYSSFNHDSLRRVKSLDASRPTGLLYGMPITVSYVREQAAQAVHPHYPLLYLGDIMARFKEAGILVRPWTVDDEDDMRKLFNMGADALITNKPDVARRFVETLTT